MNATVDALVAAIRRAQEPEPDNLLDELEQLPAVGELPSPWETWTLIGLCRYRHRQYWVAEIVRTRLSGDLQQLANMGALGHPQDLAQSGPVPGMSDWEYFFHGIGCCITHKVDGDAIDVDFWADDSTDYIGHYFHRRYLTSLRKPEPPEARLRELHPTVDAISIAVSDLLLAGALEPLKENGSHPYRLADEITAVSDVIDDFCDAWSDVDRRVWLAALIGDWPAAEEVAAGRSEISAITKPRAELCRELRLQTLKPQLHTKPYAAEALGALADMRAPDLDEYVESALIAEPSRLTSVALDIIEESGASKWCDSIYRLHSRVDSAGDVPLPSIWVRCVRYLLSHSYRTDQVASSLTKASGTVVGEAALLSLEYAPELAISIVRSGLSSDIPMGRTQIVAILSLIQAPWCQQELLRALIASDDQAKTADIRAALVEYWGATGERAVLKWEERNPHEKEAGRYIDVGGRTRGPFYSFEEAYLENRISWINREMDEFRDRVSQFRNVVPNGPHPQRTWWKFWRK